MPTLSDTEFILQKLRAAANRISGQTRVGMAQADVAELSRQLRERLQPQAPTALLPDLGVGSGPEGSSGNLLADMRNELAGITERTGISFGGGSSAPTGDADLDRANERLRRATTEAKLRGHGEEAEQIGVGGRILGALNRVLTPLSALAAFVEGAVDNARSNEKSVTQGSLGDMWHAGAVNFHKALRGEEYKNYGGLAGDILLDPVTYLSLGSSGAARTASAGTAAFIRKAVEEGADVAVRDALRSGGVKAAREVLEASAKQKLGRAARKLPRKAENEVRDVARFIEHTALTDPTKREQFLKFADDLERAATERGSGPWKSTFREAPEELREALPTELKPGLSAHIPFTHGGLELTSGKQAGRLGELADKVPGVAALRTMGREGTDFWHGVRGITDIEGKPAFDRTRGVLRESFARERKVMDKVAVSARDLGSALRKGGVETAGDAEKLFGRIEASGLNPHEALRRFLVGAGVAEKEALKAADARQFLRFELPDIARAAGVDLGEVMGHLPHVATRDAKALLREFKTQHSRALVQAMEQGGSRYGTQFAKGRELTGNISDLNEWFRDLTGKELFDESVEGAYSVYGRSMARAVSRNEAWQRLVAEGIANETQTGLVDFLQTATQAAPSQQQLKTAAAKLATHTKNLQEAEAQLKSVRRALNNPAFKADVEETLKRVGDSRELSAKLAADLHAEYGKAAGIPKAQLEKGVRKVLRDAGTGLAELRKATKNTKGILAPRELHELYKNQIDVLLNPKQNPALKAIDTFQNWWRGWAIATPGFWERNAAGLQWQVFGLAGASPKSGLRSLRTLFGDFGGYAKSLGEESRMSRAVRRFIKASPDMKYLKEAEGLGVIRTSYYENLHNLVEVSSKTGFRRFWNADFNLLNPHNVVVRTVVHKPQEAIEDWARLTLFIDGRTRLGMNAADAAQHTAHFTFLYGQDGLTIAERRIAKRLTGFYTFQSRNLALQAEYLFKKPQAFSAIGKVKRAAERNAGYNEGSEKLGFFDKRNVAIPLMFGWFLAEDMPYGSALNALPGSWDELAKWDIFNDYASPLLKNGLKLLQGEGVVQAGDVDDVKVAADWTSIPGVKAFLKAQGWLVTKDGKSYINRKVSNTIEDLWPFLKQSAGLSPNDKEGKEQRVSKLFRYLLGLGITRPTTGTKTNETFDRAKYIEEKFGGTEKRDRAIDREAEAQH